jgi:hypothetical protein
MKLHSFIPASLALLIFAMSAGVLSAANEVFIDENFDVNIPDASATPGGYVSSESEVTATRSFKEKAGVSSSRAMVLSADFVAVTPGTLAAIQYQNGNVSGTEGMTAAECYVEFVAKGSKASGEVQVNIIGWSNPGFGGETTGSISTTIKLPDMQDTFQVYRIALNDPALNGKFDPSCKTLQITFQILGSQWSNGAGNELVIDNIKFGRKAKP